MRERERERERVSWIEIIVLILKKEFNLADWRDGKFTSYKPEVDFEKSKKSLNEIYKKR